MKASHEAAVAITAGVIASAWRYCEQGYVRPHVYAVVSVSVMSAIGLFNFLNGHRS